MFRFLFCFVIVEAILERIFVYCNWGYGKFGPKKKKTHDLHKTVHTCKTLL